jgi:hypothetical protein
VDPVARPFRICSVSKYIPQFTPILCKSHLSENFSTMSATKNLRK